MMLKSVLKVSIHSLDLIHSCEAWTLSAKTEKQKLVIWVESWIY